MRNWNIELKNRVEFIKDVIKKSGTNGVVFGNSGGKDSALVGILCSKATDNTTGVIMPCQSKQNFTTDMEDAKKLAKQFSIKTKIVDLSDIKNSLVAVLENSEKIVDIAKNNINPRLRMVVLYTIAQSTNCLVAGTGNRSEIYMGYFTKWGDGACDFNPIADLTATEVFDFLKFLNVPESIVLKPPSAALFDGQTDEEDMGVKYVAIDNYILTGSGEKKDLDIIKSKHNITEHKRNLPIFYKEK